jgi:hypothetical protein
MEETPMTTIQELDNYIRNEYAGSICEALESVGGIKRVRAILGWSDHATLDSRLYSAPTETSNETI